MKEIGRRLGVLRRQQGLSLRDVADRTKTIAKRRSDPRWKVSSSWLGRIEREGHSIAHVKLQALSEALGVAYGDLIDVPTDGEPEFVPPGYPEVPASAWNWLAHHEGALIPPEHWAAQFPVTTLLPSRTQLRDPVLRRVLNHSRNRERLYGVLGSKDFTLVPVVNPGTLVEIDATVRSICLERVFYSVYERPIYFLRSHDGYACGWCELDEKQEWLSLIPSARASSSHPRWRYRQDVEVIGQVIRACGRLGFPSGFQRSREVVIREAS